MPRKTSAPSKRDKEKFNREYNSWRHMFERCYNENDKRYDNYGGRGIKVCDRWFDFYMFLNDMGRRPTHPFFKYSIDRIDNDGNYEPINCRWATPKQQANNTSRSVDKSKPCIDCGECPPEYQDGRCMRCHGYLRNRKGNISRPEAIKKGIFVDNNFSKLNKERN